MTINYMVKKMTLKPSTKEHIEKKLAKLEKFFSPNADAKVKLVLEANRVTAELTIKDGAMVYRGEDVQTDLLDAYDNAVDNIIRRIRKQKTKLEKRLRSTVFDPDLLPSDDVDYIEEDFEIIRSKKFDLKPLSVQEAILQMNLLDHQFFVFENEVTGKVNVVYRRKDGKYGLIEPS